MQVISDYVFLRELLLGYRGVNAVVVESSRELLSGYQTHQSGGTR